MSLSDRERIYQELLVLKSQNGDTDALEELILYWQPRLLRHAWYLTNHREASLDVLQEAWVAIVKNLKQLEDPRLFRSWCYRILSHKCADWVRFQKRERTLKEKIEEEQKDFFVDKEEHSDELITLRQAMNALPGEQRALLSLHYLEKMGLKEISHSLNIPEGTVKSQLYHARKALKEKMERIQR